MAEAHRPESTPVAEGLLALVKDERYVLACRNLIAQVLGADRGGATELPMATASLISAFLYTLIVVVPKQKSLGMAALGLSFKRSSKSRLFWACMLPAVSSFAVFRILAQLRQPQPDRLRGAQRREYFRVQQQEMVQRGHSLRSTPGQTAEHRAVPSRPWTTIAASVLEDVTQTLINPPHGPHDVETLGDNNSTMTWPSCLIRLHTALYCVSGGYASLQHRLAGSPFAVEQAQQRLVNRPNTLRIVGLLIFAQFAGKCFENSIQGAIRGWVRNWDRLFRSPRRQVSSLEMLHPSSSVQTQTEEALNRGVAGDSSHICGVCHQIQTDSACSKSCGHTFCWICLQHWVTTVREECPVCRSSCKPRDVLPLYNY